MKKSGYLIAIGLVLLISGCIPSLHPLYFKEDRLILEILEGKWLSSDNDTWEFKKVEKEPSYILSFTEENQPGEQSKQNHTANFEANVLKLGDCYFMDLYPGDNDQLDELNNLLSIHLISAHSFLKLEIDNSQLIIYQMNPDWLINLFKENKIRISHEVVDEDKIVLTASTRELQKFITKYEHEEEAFLEPVALTVIK